MLNVDVVWAGELMAGSRHDQTATIRSLLDRLPHGLHAYVHATSGTDSRTAFKARYGLDSFKVYERLLKVSQPRWTPTPRALQSTSAEQMVFSSRKKAKRGHARRLSIGGHHDLREARAGPRNAEPPRSQTPQSEPDIAAPDDDKRSTELDTEMLLVSLLELMLENMPLGELMEYSATRFKSTIHCGQGIDMSFGRVAENDGSIVLTRRVHHIDSYSRGLECCSTGES